jgi:hypothetical protein
MSSHPTPQDFTKDNNKPTITIHPRKKRPNVISTTTTTTTTSTTNSSKPINNKSDDDDDNEDDDTILQNIRLQQQTERNLIGKEFKIVNQPNTAAAATATTTSSSLTNNTNSNQQQRFSSALEDSSTVENLREIEKAKFIQSKIEGKSDKIETKSALLSNLFVNVKSDLILQSSVAGNSHSVVLSRVKTPQTNNTTTSNTDAADRNHKIKKFKQEQI